MQRVLIFLLISLGSCIAADKDEINVNNQTVPNAITEVNPPESGGNTTLAPPNTTTTAITTKPSPSTNATTSTHATTTTHEPKSSTTTTPKSSSTSTTATTTHSVPSTPVPHNNPGSKFDGSSFVGGIILALGLAGIGFVAFKFYKSRTELYHTL